MNSFKTWSILVAGILIIVGAIFVFDYETTSPEGELTYDPTTEEIEETTEEGEEAVTVSTEAPQLRKERLVAYQKLLGLPMIN